MEGGESLSHKYVQTLLSKEDHKALSMIALDREEPLQDLLRAIIKNYLNLRKESHHGR